MGFLKGDKSLAELAEEREHGEAEVSVLQQKVMKKQLEDKLGKGSLKYFKGNDGRPIWSRVYNWLKNQ